MYWRSEVRPSVETVLGFALAFGRALLVSLEASSGVKAFFNPNKPNGLSHPYTLDESICHSRGVRCIYFHFCSIWN